MVVLTGTKVQPARTLAMQQEYRRLAQGESLTRGKPPTTEPLAA